MKVLFITNIYPSLREPNRGVFIQNQVRALKKKGIEISVLVLDYRSLRHNKKIGFRIERNEGVNVYNFSFPISPFHGIQYLLSDLITDYAFQRTVELYGLPDIVHGHFLEGSYGIKYIKKKYGIPCVVTEHGSNVLLRNRTKIDTKHMKKLYNGIDKVIFVGNAQNEDAKDLELNNSLVIPNVIPAYFKCNKKVKTDKCFIFITVANLIPSKRIDVLIKAFNFVVTDDCNTRLVIVGSGKMENDLKNLVKDLRLENHVIFKGIVKNIDLVDLYNGANCFVLPSIFETFGLVYAEALCCGLPIISVNNGGINEIIESSCDYAKIISADCVELLANTMKEIMKSEFDKNFISMEYCNKFSEDVVSNKIIKLYCDILL